MWQFSGLVKVNINNNPTSHGELGRGGLAYLYIVHNKHLACGLNLFMFGDDGSDSVDEASLVVGDESHELLLSAAV